MFVYATLFFISVISKKCYIICQIRTQCTIILTYKDPEQILESNSETLTPQRIAQDLSSFAIDRTDLKELLAQVPGDNQALLTTMEYELQILKILSVGWGISFFVPATEKNKTQISEFYWEYIREISNNISMLTETTTGKKLDYFDILKTRLDSYVMILQQEEEQAQDPAVIMGPAFAGMCNAANDAVCVLVGTKMFTLTLGAVKEYLNAVKLEDPRLN